MRTYELTLIYRADEENYKKGKDLVKAELDKSQVKVSKEEDLGNRDLAYDIKKESKGHYFYYEIEADPAVIVELDKNFKLMNQVLKFLFVKQES